MNRCDAMVHIEPEALEQWFRHVVAKPGCTPAHLASAMQEDGVDASQAWVLAAAAQIRYGREPLSALLTAPEYIQALAALRRHTGEAGRVLCRQRAAGAKEAVRDPLSALPNRIVLPDQRQLTLHCVCHSPRVALFGGFLDSSECDELIALARKGLRRSQVTDANTGAARVDGAYRSSSTVFLDAGVAALVGRIEERASQLLGHPVSHFESIAVNRYGRRGEFREHVDYLENLDDERARLFGDAGDRVATLVLYLNDAPAGGATLFPIAGIEIRPQRGSALCFTYQAADGAFDPASLHAGAPVTQGEKWIATLWVHARPVRDPDARKTASEDTPGQAQDAWCRT